MALLSSTLLLRTHSLTLLTISFYLLYWPGQLLNATPVWLLGESMSIRPAEFAHDEPTLDSPSSSLPILPGSRQRNAPAGGFRPPSLAGSLPVSAAAAAQTGGGDSQGELELLALLALVVAGYAFMQFVFAGDLALLAMPSSSSSSSTPNKSSSSSSASPSKPQQQPSSSSTMSSRYGEELHTLFAAQSRWLTFSGLRMLGSAALAAWIYVFHSHGNAFPTVSSAVAGGPVLLANRVTFTVALCDMLFWGYFWTSVKEETRLVAQNVARLREAEDLD